MPEAAARSGCRPWRAALVLAAIAPICLAAGCTVPRPVPHFGSASCDLPSTPLTVDVGSVGIGPAAPVPDPLTTILEAAAAARANGPGPREAGDAPLASHLVLSGGGQHGAFGTGFLAGLAPLPDYDIVTGVSTGALQAPLALLGNQPPPPDRVFDSADDFPADANRPGRREIDDLFTAYTVTREDTLYRSQGVPGVIRRARLGDLVPLRHRIGILITDRTLRRMAALGPDRGFYVLLLNWDSGEAERVDMLELARRHARGRTEARGCFIDVLIAASSEPLGTPPVAIDDSLYVDAGLRYGVFAADAARAGAEAARRARLLPGAAALARTGPLIRTDMIRNGDVAVRPERLERYSALDVMKRGRSILVNQVYAFSMRDVLDLAGPDHQVRFAFITPRETDDGPPAGGVEFDPAYMTRMLEVGQERGERGAWNRVEPPAGGQ